MKKVVCLVCAIILGLFGFANISFASEVLIVSSGTADWIAIPMFEAKHPDVRISIEAVSPLYSELANKFIVQDSYTDLYRLNSNLGIHQQLRTKGYYMDLSIDDTIKSFISKLSSPFQEQVLASDGTILGVPSFLILEYPVFFNKDIAKEIGLSERDVPQNILDLLRFVNQWEDKYGDQFPKYAPFRADEASSYALAHRNPYVGLVLEMYKDTFTALSQPLTYQTPLFYDLLDEIERWTYSDDAAYWRAMENMPDYEHCLFYSMRMFDDEILTSVCGTGRYINLPIAEGYPIVQAYEMECAIVNPATKHEELAVDLARCYVEDCQPGLLRILCPSINTPYQSPDYSKNLNELKAWYQDEKQKLDLIPKEEQADQQEIVDHIGNMIAEEIANPYVITSTAIEQYHTDISPYLISRGEGIYESEAICFR